MGLFSSIAKLFQKDPPVSECCVDGVCVCSSDGDDLVSDPILTLSDGLVTSPSSVSLTATTGAVTCTSTDGASSTTVECESDSCCEESIVAEKSLVSATADEINMALETAAEADREAAENYTPTLPPAAPPKKKRSNAKKASLKLNRKSSTRKKKS